MIDMYPLVMTNIANWFKSPLKKWDTSLFLWPFSSSLCQSLPFRVTKRYQLSLDGHRWLLHQSAMARCPRSTVRTQDLAEAEQEVRHISHLPLDAVAGETRKASRIQDLYFCSGCGGLAICKVSDSPISLADGITLQFTSVCQKNCSQVIKHGWLENGPFSLVTFLARNLHSVRGFSSQPCLMKPGGSCNVS